MIKYTRSEFTMDAIVHLLIPVAALLLFYDKRYLKYIILLLPLALFSDIDVLLALNLHRMLLHSVFILVPAVIVAVYAYKKGTMDTPLLAVALIAIVYLSSHLVLDLFQGGVALLYPLTSATYACTCAFLYVGGNIVANVSIGVVPLYVGNETPLEFLSTEGVGMLLAFMLALFVWRRLTRSR